MSDKVSKEYEVFRQSAFPAIDRALSLLKSRLGVTSPHNLHHENDMPTSQSNIPIEKPSITYISKDLPLKPAASLSKRAILLTDKEMSRTDKNTLQQRRRGNSKPNHQHSYEIKGKPIGLRSIFNLWRVYTKERVVAKVIERARVAGLVEKSRLERYLPPATRSHCVERFGKERLAALYNRWRVKRRVFRLWLTFFLYSDE